MPLYYWTGASSGLWTTVGNWVESDGTAPSAVPGTGDSVIFDGRATAALTGSPAGTIRLTKVQIKQSCTVSIGTPIAPITAAVDLFIVGEESDDASTSSGSQQICWNFGATASGYSGTIARILQSNTTAATVGLAVVQLLGTHASNKLYVEGQSSVGWGVSFPGQAFTLLQANVTGPNAQVTLGSGGTLTTAYIKDGTTTINCAFTTLELHGGTCKTEGAGAITTAGVTAGNFISNSTGTITTLDVGNGGTADFSKTSIARTVTTGVCHGTGIINLQNGQARSVTFTNGIDLLDGAIAANVLTETDENIAFAAP